jgi:hypothetical protein
MVCELGVNAASFGMNVFKYTMNLLYQRLALEWKDLDITYPQWVSTLVLDEVYYITTLVVMSLTCFAMGMIIGIVAVVV